VAIAGGVVHLGDQRRGHVGPSFREGTPQRGEGHGAEVLRVDVGVIVHHVAAHRVDDCSDRTGS
jgi:hypothetical protein